MSNTSKLSGLRWKILTCCICVLLMAGFVQATTRVTPSNIMLVGSNSIGDLSDISLVGLTDGQLFVWNATAGKWQNTDHVDVNTWAVANLTDISFASLASGDILTWNGVNWVNTGLNATVEAIIDAYTTMGWKSSWDGDVNSLIAAANIDWNKVTNVPSIGSYSYLIQADDPVSGNYSARYPNGTIAFTSTNASYTINSCTNIYGTTTLLRNGDYNLLSGSQIIVAENSTFRGESWNAKLILPSDSVYTWIVTTVAGANYGTGNGNDPTNKEVTTENIVVENLHIIGSGVSGEGIVLQNVHNSKITKNWVENFDSTGISVLYHAENVDVDYNRVTDVTGSGIRLEEASGVSPSKNLNARYNYVETANRGINFEGIYSGQLTGNTLIDCDYGVGINLDAVSQGRCQQLQVHSNNIYHYTYQAAKQGIYVNNTVSSDFSSNNIQNCSTIFNCYNSEYLTIDGVTGTNSTYGIILTNSNNTKIGAENSLNYIVRRAVELYNSNNNTISGKYANIETSATDYDAMLIDSNSHYNTFRGIDVNQVAASTKAVILVNGNYNTITNCFARGTDVFVHINAGTYTRVTENTGFFYSSHTYGMNYNASAASYTFMHRNFLNGKPQETSLTGTNTTATTTVITHNLCTTPTHVLASFNQTGITYTWTATSTQITITFAALTDYTLPASLNCYITADVY